jgi:hypothetical protein
MRGSVFALLLTIAAGGCGGRATTGPAWPAASTTAEDGGESLEPQHTSVTAALEEADDDEADVEVTKELTPPASAPAAEIPATTVTAPIQPPSDEVIISDEMIIEIED